LQKRNLVVIGVVLALALALFVVARLSGNETVTGRVIVYLDGERYAEGRLGQTEEIVVTGKDGEINVIAFTEDGFYMRHSSCDNQLCVNEGIVTKDNFARRALGTRIICLPNRVIAELETDEVPETDMPMPDV